MYKENLKDLVKELRALYDDENRIIEKLIK